MATVNYIIKGKTTTVYVRFKHKNTDLTSSMQIYVDIKFWDKKNQRIKTSAIVPGRDKINETLALFKLHLLSKFNLDFSQGEFIDKHWLDNAINTYYNRPENEGSHAVYLLDFATWWVENKAPNFKSNTGELLNDISIANYRIVGELLQDYENHISKRIKLTETTSEILNDFADFLVDNKQFATSTTKIRMAQLKFLCNRAEEANLPINKNFKGRVFVKNKADDFKYPYLNEEEITKVFNFKTTNENLIITRDNWIIGLWTGLRISDFLTRLNSDNLNGDFINIKTKKTKTNVSIPMHWQVKEVLKKYNGQLPPKQSQQEFNENIKEIAKQLNFNQKMKGGITMIDSKLKKKRKIIGVYEKWQLMTSHICRRSFCTNLFGKVPNQVIMDVQGWASEAQMHAYNQQTNLESAIAIKELWEKNN